MEDPADQRDLLGFHVLWTRPRASQFRANSGRPFEPCEPVELLSAAMSAALWRRHNGPCRLYTDALGLDWLERNKLADLWDDIDHTMLEAIPRGINAAVFWDIAKVFILSRLERPAAALDLDLIVWDRLPPAPHASIRILHWEAPLPPWYASAAALRTKPHYSFAQDWDWTLDAANTAFLASSDQAAAVALWNAGGHFAQNTTPDAAQSEFLFAVQRLIPMEAKRHGVGVAALLPYRHDPAMPFEWNAWREREWRVPLPFAPDGLITHLWMLKHVLKQRREWLDQYCASLFRRFDADVSSGGVDLQRVRRVGDLLHSHLGHST